MARPCWTLTSFPAPSRSGDGSRARGIPSTGQFRAGLVDLLQDAVRLAGSGDRGGLVEHCQRVLNAAVGGGDVSEADHVRGRAGQVTSLEPQPRGLLKVPPGYLQLAFGVRRYAQVPQRLSDRGFVARL